MNQAIRDAQNTHKSFRLRKKSKKLNIYSIWHEKLNGEKISIVFLSALSWNILLFTAHICVYVVVARR